MDELKVVTIGGGTGSYTALTGLKRITRRLTAVVTMADDGGSSGRLRDEFGHLPPGDVRRCLVALSASRQMNRILRRLFEYRFDKGLGLNGHSFGNLFLTALTELTGSTEQAILEASKLLNVRGRVLPVTTDDVQLLAELEDGTVISGESNIGTRRTYSRGQIRRVFLSRHATVCRPTADAIRDADVIVIGPGDLFTSIVPNLLVNGVKEAVRACRGTRIYVCNLMTKRAETDGFPASSFLAQVTRYLGGPGALDAMIASNSEFPKPVLNEYAREHSCPVVLDRDACLRMVPQVYEAPLATFGLVRHNPGRLARLIVKVHQDRTVHGRQVEALPEIREVEPEQEEAVALTAG